MEKSSPLKKGIKNKKKVDLRKSTEKSPKDLNPNEQQNISLKANKNTKINKVFSTSSSIANQAEKVSLPPISGALPAIPQAIKQNKNEYPLLVAKNKFSINDEKEIESPLKPVDNIIKTSTQSESKVKYTELKD